MLKIRSKMLHCEKSKLGVGLGYNLPTCTSWVNQCLFCLKIEHPDISWLFIFCDLTCHRMDQSTCIHIYIVMVSSETLPKTLTPYIVGYVCITILQHINQISANLKQSVKHHQTNKEMIPCLAYPFGSVIVGLPTAFSEWFPC